MIESGRWIARGEVELRVRRIGQAGVRDVVMLPSLGRGSHSRSRSRVLLSMPCKDSFQRVSVTERRAR